MFPAIALAATLLGAPTTSAQDPTITLTTRGESVAALLKELSKQSGIAFDSTPAVSTEIVLANFKGVPLSQVTGRLAKVVGAEWHIDGSVRRLTRPSSLVHDQELAERKDRLTQAKKELAEIADKYRNQKPFDAAAADALATRAAAIYTKFKGHVGDAGGLDARMALEADTPAGRLAVAIVSVLDPATLAALPPGERFVFSPNPNRMQLPIRANLTAAFARFVAEQDLYAAAVKRKIPDLTGGYAGVYGTDAVQAPSQYLVAVEHSPFNPSLTIRIKMADSKGEILSETTTLLLGNSSQAENSTPHEDEGLGELSQASLQMLADLKLLTSGRTFLDPKDAFVSKLIDPVANDPLSFISADGLLDLANKKSENMIAVIPDEGFEVRMMNFDDGQGKLKLSKFRSWLDGQCSVEEGSGWFVATPKRFIDMRETRANRAAMSDFFRMVQQDGWASLDAMAGFVAKMPNRYGDSMVPMLAFFVYPELIGCVQPNEVEALRIYGMLSPEGKRAITTTGLLAKNLPPGALAELTHMIYKADANLTMSSTPDSAGRLTLASEVTVALPNGVPPDAVVSMMGGGGENSKVAVMVDGVHGSVSNYDPLEPRQLAYLMAQGAKAPANDPREQYSFERFRLGSIRRYNFSVRLTDVIGLWTRLTECKFPRSTPLVTFDQLPSSFRDQVTKELENLNRSQPRATPPPVGKP